SVRILSDESVIRPAGVGLTRLLPHRRVVLSSRGLRQRQCSDRSVAITRLITIERGVSGRSVIQEAAACVAKVPGSLADEGIAVAGAAGVDERAPTQIDDAHARSRRLRKVHVAVAHGEVAAADRLSSAKTVGPGGDRIGTGRL